MADSTRGPLPSSPFPVSSGAASCRQGGCRPSGRRAVRRTSKGYQLPHRPKGNSPRFEHLRHAKHEWTHYDQYLTTSIGALLHRLRVARRYAAHQVLRDVIQATGKINSLPGLIARETHLLDPIVTSSRVLSEIGVRNSSSGTSSPD